MGKCESVKASIGIKILLSDLISQINETNVHLIKYMLDAGCIEDENEFYNQTYQSIDRDVKDSELKEYLITQFAELFDMELLVPLKDIMSTERWGYDREGTNSASRPMDFDLSIDTEEYKDIEKWRVVFIITQHS